MIKTSGVDHITLTVKDLKKSKEFYNKVCGMKFIMDEKDSAGLSDGTFSLWLSTCRDKNSQVQNFNRNNTGLDHWAFKVTSMKDLKEIEELLKNMKIPLEDGGITDDDFGDKAIFTEDPDGMKVEFHLR